MKRTKQLCPVNLDFYEVQEMIVFLASQLENIDSLSNLSSHSANTLKGMAKLLKDGNKVIKLRITGEAVMSLI